jgi:NAD(P)-dependent dehydrogenase (short-subunit alcohol dehydrogenase family)
MAKTLEVDMSGKIALVTGATGGIGKEVARELARMHAEVVIGARNRDRGEAAREEITRETGNRTVSVSLLDVSDSRSIHAFADSFSRAHEKLHVLVNNAGVWFTDRRESAEHHELTFATNVLGPYLLTSLLKGALRRAAPARVVNVVSSFSGNYDASDLEFRRRKYDGMKVYAQSKTALRMLTWGQARRLEESGVTVNAAAPGFVRTDFNQYASGFMASMINLSARLFAVSPKEGADTPLWVAVAPELAGITGKYFDKRTARPGNFDDAAAIADLEQQCAAATRSREPRTEAPAASHPN